MLLQELRSGRFELPSPNGRWGPCRDVIATGPIRQSWCGRGVGQDGIRASIGQGGELNGPSLLSWSLDFILYDVFFQKILIVVQKSHEKTCVCIGSHLCAATCAPLFAYMKTKVLWLKASSRTRTHGCHDLQVLSYEVLFKDEGHALTAHCGNCSHMRLRISQINSAGATRLNIETLRPKRWDAVRDFQERLLLAALGVFALCCSRPTGRSISRRVGEIALSAATTWLYPTISALLVASCHIPGRSSLPP